MKTTKKMEDDLKEQWKTTSKKWKTTSKEKGRTTSIKIGIRPQAQLKKSTLIGCDIIVN